MGILRDLADTIDPNLSFTFDCPSLNEKGRMPILDMEIWTQGSQLRHSFFRKPCAPNRVIQSRSAVSSRTKRDTLFSEGMRMLSAIDNETLQLDKVPVLTLFADAMRKAGYGPMIRQDILTGILKRDRELRETGQRYRSRAEILAAKEQSQLKHLNTWFLRGQTTSVLKVQATPGEALAKMVKEKLAGALAPDGGTTLVAQATGTSILAGLRAPDPLREKGCPHKDQCQIDPRQSCGAARVVYKLSCSLCPAFYLGTSGHTCHKRSLEHFEALRTGNQKYAIAKHFSKEHRDWTANNDPPFTFSIVRGPNIQGNIQRYLAEAIQIRDHASHGTALLNSKGEWGRINLKRLAVVSE